MEKKFDVIGFGDPFQDLDIQLSKLPETNVNMRMNDYCFMGGGNVPTAMVAAARLGLKSSILGVVGDDMLGRLATADFTYNHVDTSHLKVAAGKRTNFCLCVAEQEIDGKEFISKPGDFDPLTPSDLDRDYIQSAKALHIGQFTPAIIKACEWMHEAGGVVSIDAAYYRPDIYENYRHLDIFIGSETYYNVMCQTEGYTGGRADIRRVLRAIQSQGPKTVIFTFGADGCIGLCGDEFLKFRLSRSRQSIRPVQAMCSTEPISTPGCRVGTQRPAAGSAPVFQRSNAPAPAGAPASRRCRFWKSSSPRAKLTEPSWTSASGITNMGF